MAHSTTPNYRELGPEERQAFLEEETSRDDWGATLITIGVIFLLFDIFISLFVGRDIREGAGFFSNWMIVQSIAGLVLIAVGLAMKRRAHSKDDA